MEKKIICAAYVIERHPILIEGKGGFKVGLQPEPGKDGGGNFILLGGQYIETTDKEFFKQGIRYEIEMTITRKA